MRDMFFRIIEGDGTDVSLIVEDNGILETHVPRGFDRKDVLKCIGILEPEERNEIISIQKKEKEKFRKKVSQMIDELKKEFNLRFNINLRFQVKTTKLINYKFDIYGIIPEGLITMGAVLQFYPDDIVRKIVRLAVSAIAAECENRFRKINTMEITSISVPDGNAKRHVSHVADSEKYRLPLSRNMMKIISNDFVEAIDKVCEDMKEHPILSAFMD